MREFVSMRGFAGKYSFEGLSDAAFSIRNFSRKTIYTLYEKHRRCDAAIVVNVTVNVIIRLLVPPQHDWRPRGR